jgi:hypothetical protein
LDRFADQPDLVPGKPPEPGDEFHVLDEMRWETIASFDPAQHLTIPGDLQSVDKGDILDFFAHLKYLGETREGESIAFLGWAMDQDPDKFTIDLPGGTRIPVWRICDEGIGWPKGAGRIIRVNQGTHVELVGRLEAMWRDVAGVFQFLRERVLLKGKIRILTDEELWDCALRCPGDDVLLLFEEGNPRALCSSWDELNRQRVRIGEANGVTNPILVAWVGGLRHLPSLARGLRLARLQSVCCFEITGPDDLDVVVQDWLSFVGRVEKAFKDDPADSQSRREIEERMTVFGIDSTLEPAQILARLVQDIPMVDVVDGDQYEATAV